LVFYVPSLFVHFSLVFGHVLIDKLLLHHTQRRQAAKIVALAWIADTTIYTTEMGMEFIAPDGTLR
jgi:hypothetical protein